MIKDDGKYLEIDYNLLNLPAYIFNTDTHDEMLFEYAFGGEKLKKVSIIDDTTRTRLYMGGFEFLDDEPEAFHHAEGRIVLSDSLPRFQFKIADHLGNTVVLFEDKDNSGTISTIIPQDPEDAEVVQRNLYYPFGLQLDGTWKHLTVPKMNYTYNNKEWENDLGLGWLFYGARCSDPATGRFTGIDRFADKFAFQSPFAMAANNPIIFMDVNGDSVWVSVGNDEFINYTPNMEYKGDNMFAQNVVNSLNTMNSSEAGEEVLNFLVASENNYSFVNVVSTDKSGNPVEGVRFRPHKKGGGVIEAGASTNVGTIAHELFHGYQFESGMDAASTAGEVGAYLFKEIVTLQAGVPSGSSVSSNKYGANYDSAHSNLLFNGYNEPDYISANIFFKVSSKNATGLYNQTKLQFTLFPPPPIAKFLPVFK